MRSSSSAAAFRAIVSSRRFFRSSTLARIFAFAEAIFSSPSPACIAAPFDAATAAATSVGSEASSGASCATSPTRSTWSSPSASSSTCKNLPSRPFTAEIATDPSTPTLARSSPGTRARSTHPPSIFVRVDVSPWTTRVNSLPPLQSHPFHTVIRPSAPPITVLSCLVMTCFPNFVIGIVLNASNALPLPPTQSDAFEESSYVRILPSAPRPMTLPAAVSDDSTAVSGVSIFTLAMSPLTNTPAAEPSSMKNPAPICPDYDLAGSRTRERHRGVRNRDVPHDVRGRGVHLRIHDLDEAQLVPFRRGDDRAIPVHVHAIHLALEELHSQDQRRRRAAVAASEDSHDAARGRDGEALTNIRRPVRERGHRAADRAFPRAAAGREVPSSDVPVDAARHDDFTPGHRTDARGSAIVVVPDFHDLDRGWGRGRRRGFRGGGGGRRRRRRPLLLLAALRLLHRRQRRVAVAAAVLPRPRDIRRRRRLRLLRRDRARDVRQVQTALRGAHDGLIKPRAPLHGDDVLAIAPGERHRPRRLHPRRRHAVAAAADEDVLLREGERARRARAAVHRGRRSRRHLPGLRVHDQHPAQARADVRVPARRPRRAGQRRGVHPDVFRSNRDASDEIRLEHLVDDRDGHPGDVAARGARRVRVRRDELVRVERVKRERGGVVRQRRRDDFVAGARVYHAEFQVGNRGRDREEFSIARERERADARARDVRYRAHERGRGVQVVDVNRRGRVLRRVRDEAAVRLRRREARDPPARAEEQARVALLRVAEPERVPCDRDLRFQRGRGEGVSESDDARGRRRSLFMERTRDGKGSARRCASFISFQAGQFRNGRLTSVLASAYETCPGTTP
eukprot:30980-Pelagococcus_subviridis.AAC.42